MFLADRDCVFDSIRVACVVVRDRCFLGEKEKEERRRYQDTIVGEKAESPLGLNVFLPSNIDRSNVPHPIL